jgi:hypothetical protein
MYYRGITHTEARVSTLQVTSTGRSSLAGIAITALAAALLTIPLAQPADAATPKCMGKKATIVGTAGNDTIVGTARADVIVARGGADRIDGRGGNDIICGGGGNDTIYGRAGRDRVKGGFGKDTIRGGGGNDRLMGSAGNDTIYGNRGDDTIDGGAGTDACYQGAGTGKVVNCEPPAAAPDPAPNPAPDPVPDPAPETKATSDLAVTASGPKRPVTRLIPFSVRVRNNGPDAMAYTLTLRLSTQRATCTAPWTGESSKPKLAAGANRMLGITATCTKTRNGSKVRLVATVSAKGTDPVPDNDTSRVQARLR